MNFKVESSPELRGNKNLSPFENWHDRYYSLVKAKRNWQIITLILLVLVAILVASNTYISTKVSFVPYIVEIQEGEVKIVGKAIENNYSISEEQKKYFLKEFIENTKNIPSDKVMFGRLYNKSLYFASDVTKNKLKEIYMKDKIVERLKKKETVSIQIESVNKVSGTKDSYQVRWNESLYSKEGSLKGIRNMSGIFTLDVAPPKTEESLYNNPLGILITDFSQSMEKN